MLRTKIGLSSEAVYELKVLKAAVPVPPLATGSWK